MLLNYCMTLNDTIAAIATPAGEGGIGVVRITGSEALAIAGSHFRHKRGRSVTDFDSHRLYYGTFNAPEGAIDEVCLVYMKAPNSYTRQDSIEISCHGSPSVLRSVLNQIIKSGARIAEPGEFTKRAFLNGRIDLSQAEGVIDLIKARSEGAARAALNLMEGGLASRIEAVKQKLVTLLSHLEASIDFPDEEIETADDSRLAGILDDSIKQIDSLVKSYETGRFLKKGMLVAIIGKPNVGKSSLLNSLLEEDRSIVTHIPGTTRDLIRAETEISGIPVELIDTAGLNRSPDEIESIGIELALGAAESADLVVALFDGSREWDEEDGKTLGALKKARAGLALVNKSDLPQKLVSPESGFSPAHISVNNRIGLEAIEEKVKAVAGSGGGAGSEPLVTRSRHLSIFNRIADDLRRAKEELPVGREISASGVWDALEEIKRFTGESYTEEVLSKIFDEFCIGK
jgi:tRNA modification GTPase